MVKLALLYRYINQQNLKMKKLIVMAFAIFSGLSFAQENTEAPKSNWTKSGVFTLLFNQSAFNNDWQGGGVNNLAVNGAINYSINYKKDKTIWDNKFLVSYGSTKTEASDDFIKTDDRLEMTSAWGRQATEKWYYSATASLRTQFDDGFSGDDLISGFFSPAYLQFGPGMLWKDSDNFKINIAPLTGRFVFVNPKFTNNGSSFGVAQGETVKSEFGTGLSVYYKTDLFKNVTLENIFNAFGNYIATNGSFDAIDFDYTLNLNMKINKYLSTNISAQAIYDKNAVAAVQVREVLGIGFNYKF